MRAPRPMGKLPCLAVALFCAFGLPVLAETPSAPWPAELVDPGAKAYGAADLVLPMPCGASMAFQRIDIPMEAADPLADVRLRLGQSDEAMGFSEYLRPVWLRGGFAPLPLATELNGAVEKLVLMP